MRKRVPKFIGIRRDGIQYRRTGKNRWKTITLQDNVINIGRNLEIIENSIHYELKASIQSLVKSGFKLVYQ